MPRPTWLGEAAVPLAVGVESPPAAREPAGVGLEVGVAMAGSSRDDDRDLRR